MAEKVLTEEEIRYQKLVEEELALVEKAKETALLSEEMMPPIVRKDEYGNDMPHILINGKYLPEPIANLAIQEKRVVIEYKRLEELKKEVEKYKKVSKQ